MRKRPQQIQCDLDEPKSYLKNGLQRLGCRTKSVGLSIKVTVNCGPVTSILTLSTEATVSISKSIKNI